MEPASSAWQRFSWRRRLVVLENGRMSWHSTRLLDRLFPEDAEDSCRRRGSIDFGLTSCEILAAPGSETKFVLRPRDGSRWSNADEHRRQGTGAAFTFDCTGSGVSRDQWLQYFQQHIARGQARVNGELESGIDPVIDSVLTRADVSLCAAGPLDCCCVCLEDLELPGDHRHCDGAACGCGGPIVRTECGHYFHEACVRPWLQARRRCPLCRTKLLRKKGGRLHAATVVSEGAQRVGGSSGAPGA